MFDRILFVCTGNICRSPMAEYLLKHALADIGSEKQVRSAGVMALVDHPAEATVTQLLMARGIDPAGHRGRQVGLETTRWADLILVMEQHHKESITHLDPTTRGKTFLLGHWQDQNIPDPYQRDKHFHQQVMAQIDDALARWVDKLA